MNFSTITRMLSLSAVGCGLAFANNIVDYAVLSNAQSMYTNPVGQPNIKIGVSNAIQFNRTGASPATFDRLVGTNISITDVTRLLPNPLLSRNCIACSLTFTTGTLNNYSNPSGSVFLNGYPVTPTFVFNAGGSASITGGVDLNNNGILDAGDIPAGSTLMSGNFIGPVTASSDHTTTDFRAVAGIILNSQNAQLNQYLFGNPFSGPVWTGVMNITFNPFGPMPIGSNNNLPLFNSRTIISGSLVNSAVPEPGSVLLFSSLTVVLGIGIARRRRQQQTNG